MRTLKTISKLMMISIIALMVVSCGSDNSKVVELQKKVDELQAKVSAYESDLNTTNKNLKLFDDLDLVAFNGRDMNHISDIHHPDIDVYNVSTGDTKGFDPQHKKDVQWLFDTFSDFDIYEHTVGFGGKDKDGNQWTAGISKSKGTFDKPMKFPNGTVIQPTGKTFDVRIATLAKWKDGRILEEWLFWDNEDWMRQIGVTQ
jgi:outer membrane murein-binding lipoprotein Lpp